MKARTYGVVLVEGLHVHDEPGGRVLEHETLDHQQRVELVVGPVTRPKATWWRMAGKAPRWVAEKNASGAVFLRIEHVPDAPPAPPPAPPRPFPLWWLIAGVIAVLLIAVAVSFAAAAIDVQSDSRTNCLTFSVPGVFDYACFTRPKIG